MYAPTTRATGVTVTPLDLTADYAAALQKYLEANPESDMTEANSDQEMALAVAADGTEYLLGTEGVGWPLTDTGNEVDVWMAGEHSFQLTPAMVLTLTKDEVHERATGDPVDLADFVRKFGARLEQNFWLWHDALTRKGGQ